MSTVLHSGDDSAHHASEVEIIVTDANDEPQDWTVAEFLDHFQWDHEKMEDCHFAYRPDNDDRHQEEAGALTEESSHSGTKSVYGVDPDGNESRSCGSPPGVVGRVGAAGGRRAAVRQDQRVCLVHGNTGPQHRTASVEDGV